MREKGSAIFIVFLLTVSAGGLWAQMSGETIAYDTIKERSKFSYTIGTKFAMNDMGLNLQVPWLGSGGTQNFDCRYHNMGWSGYFQADWKFFMMGFDVGYQIKSLRIEARWNGSTWDDEEEFPRDEIGINTQFLFKLPLVNKDFNFSVLAGPELAISQNACINGLAGLELGFRLTQHHFLTIGYSQVFPLTDFDGLMGIFAGVGPMLNNNLKYNKWDSRGMPFGFQATVGIRTQVYKKTYYYKGHEVGTGR